jgi:hypothetical protein
VPGDPLRAWGGLLNAAALLLFVGNAVGSALLGSAGALSGRDAR